MPTALLRSPSPGSHVPLWLLLLLLALSVDLIKSNVKGRPSSWMAELSSHCNIWAGSSECWVPPETDCSGLLQLSVLELIPDLPCSEGGQPTARRDSRVSTQQERNPERKMLITYFDLVALEMASPTLATTQDCSPGPELLLDKERCLGLLLWLPG